MGMLTAVLSVAGAFLVTLVAAAVTVAGWEWLRQRERREALRRYRANQAATSPLPLMDRSRPAEFSVANRSGGANPPTFGQAVAKASRRDGNWIETRPMVLSPRRGPEERVQEPEAVAAGEPDLLLE